MTGTQATLNCEGGDFLPPPRPHHDEMSTAAVTLPGKGDRGDGCGSSVPHHCNTCGSGFVVESSCMLRTCPHCWRKWAAKEARVAGLRMWAGAQLVTGRRRGFRLLHCVVSLPHSEDLQQQRKVARITAKNHGISGGLTIFHPFRKDKIDQKYVPDGFDHFHIIGLARGDVKPGTSKEIFFKVIDDAEYKDYRGFRSARAIKRCIFYLLTHCGIMTGRHTVTWFGELSYNMLSTDRLMDAFPDMADGLRPRKQLCPGCGSEDIEKDWITDWTDPMNVEHVDNRVGVG